MYKLNNTAHASTECSDIVLEAEKIFFYSARETAASTRKQLISIGEIICTER